jgi:LysR family transcriptional regulator, low CO2-responsive transcriptional regulator
MRKRTRLFTAVDLQIMVGLAAGKTQAAIAEQMQLEQPAVSKHLRAAEKRAGIPLVQHDGRRIRLTTTGRYVADAAKVIIAKLDDIEVALSSQRSGDGGFVRVIACSTPGSYVLPAVVARFLQLFPGVKIEVDVRPLTQLWGDFNAGAYDFAVIPQVMLPIDMWVEPLYEDPIMLFAHPGHRLASADCVTVRDLQDETLIGRFNEGYWRTVFGGQPVRSRRIELTSLEGAKRMVETGLGVGVLFRSAIQGEIDQGRFTPLAFVDTDLRQLFCLARRVDLAQTSVAQRFGEFLLAHFSEHTAA